MKYVLNYKERPGGSFEAYEAAQERVLQLFQTWTMPESLTILQFLTRLGEFGGYIVIETGTPADIHFLATVFAAFECKVEPVMDVGDSVAAEIRAIQYRKGQGV